MNDRIEDLARQCMSMRFFVDTASEDFDYKKFAQVIFQECIDVADDTALGEPTYGWMVANNIASRFGIKR